MTLAWRDGRPVPCTAAPFPFPDVARGAALAAPFGRLALAVARDADWLATTLAPTAAVDPLVAFLLSIRRERAWEAAVLRSDYMHDAPTGRLRQVELNTMSCAFAALSTHVATRHGARANAALDDVADLLAHCARSARTTPGVVVMVVRDDESNVHDQRLVVEALAARGVECRRRTLADLRGACRGGALVLEDGRRASVVYYRACYDAEELAAEWQRETRAALEACDAVAVPSATMQLVGCKRVQQALCAPGAVERFVDAADAAALRAVFARQWSAAALPAPVARAARARPECFVLKPQREGGGHNLHGADLVAALDAPDCAQYVLMERIRPRPRTCVVVRGEDGGRPVPRAVAELGIFSTLLAPARGPPVRNGGSGWLLRVKSADEREGGVACGASALSTPTSCVGKACA